MDGSNIELLINTSLDVVGELGLFMHNIYYIIYHLVHQISVALISDDIAMDWIGNNLYWTDAVYARIEVIDLDTRHRRELLRTGGNSLPRAIAVDPSTRLVHAM